LKKMMGAPMLLLLAACSAAAATAPAAPDAAAASNFVLHWGDWCFSGSSGHANMVAGNASDAAVCEARCAADAGCAAFAFQGLNARNAPDQFRCYLFRAAVRSAPANPSEGWGNDTVCGTKPHLRDFGYYYGLSPRDGLLGFANHSTTTFVLNGAPNPPPGTGENITALAQKDIADLLRLKSFGMTGILFSVQVRTTPS
jgi:hypothetical protein